MLSNGPLDFYLVLSIGFLIELYGRNVSSHRQKVMMHSSFSGPLLRHYNSDVLLKALDPECKGISVFEKRWHRSRLVSGVLLIITSILAIVFYIITWGFAVEDKATTTDGNDNAIQRSASHNLNTFCFPALFDVHAGTAMCKGRNFCTRNIP